MIKLLNVSILECMDIRPQVGSWIYVTCGQHEIMILDFQFFKS